MTIQHITVLSFYRRGDKKALEYFEQNNDLGSWRVIDDITAKVYIKEETVFAEQKEPSTSFIMSKE